ncbi:hypothetical protein ACQP10_38055 (plasmid) [Streptosporangium sandarakinum]
MAAGDLTCHCTSHDRCTCDHCAAIHAAAHRKALREPAKKPLLQRLFTK